ncbi:MAG: class I SAM-dependent methyltransferase [Candidatus Paceibacterota bacterium]
MNAEHADWGNITDTGVEMWDTAPVFHGVRVGFWDWARLLFYPKKWVLYRAVLRAVRGMGSAGPVRVLDAGCGTGASVIDLKTLCGDAADIVGADVVGEQIVAARDKARDAGAAVSFVLYDGEHLPFPDASFDAIYTSDVLGHVRNPSVWLAELARVLKSGGTLAMFSESAIGRHALIRRYLLRHGLNADPHRQFHISLYAKQELRDMMSDAGFAIERMMGVFLAAFFVHPQEFAPALRADGRFPLLRALNAALCFLRKIFGRVFVAAGELYGLIEMYAIGRWVESQGYIILAKKR